MRQGSILSLFLLFLSAALVGCQEKPEPTVESQIELSQHELILKVDATAQLDVELTPTSDEKVVWDSSNPQVVSVADGLVRAVAVGQAVIKVSLANGQSDQCVVTVETNTAFKLSNSEVSLKAGEMIVLSTQLSQTENEKVQWHSSDPTIVKVGAGICVCLKSGSVEVTATYGEETQVCHFDVNGDVKYDLDRMVNTIYFPPTAKIFRHKEAIFAAGDRRGWSEAPFKDDPTGLTKWRFVAESYMWNVTFFQSVSYFLGKNAYVLLETAFPADKKMYNKAKKLIMKVYNFTDDLKEIDVTVDDKNDTALEGVNTSLNMQGLLYRYVESDKEVIVFKVKDLAE